MEFTSHYANVLGAKMHYIEQGKGMPIVLLHGLPGSSYTWRHIIPYLSPLGRCIAPDLIGMAQSEKPNIAYSIEDHINYLSEFIKALDLKQFILVMHGWGSILGLHYAMAHEDRCKGLVFYESYLRPVTGDAFSLPLQEQVSIVEEHHLDGMEFINKILPQAMIKPLPEKELEHYRKPMAEKLLQTYLKELPRGTGESKLDKIIAQYSEKLIHSYTPKLLLYSVPGFVTTMATVVWAKENLHNLEIAEVGEELHYAQESNPTLMGETISIWLQGIEVSV